MDKTILKDFAIYSRNKLIQEIKNKASFIGIGEEGIENPLPESTSDMLMFDVGTMDPYILTGKEIKQYEKLKRELETREENEDYERAYSTLIEEVAYTWFNRLIALRFMEVNNYMPNRLRTISSGIDGVNEPELVTNYEASGFDFTKEEEDQLLEWRLDASADSMEKMFQYLFIKQCNALNDNLPELFEKTDDYAELLLNISYNDKDGVLYKLVHEIPEEYFDVESDDGNGQVEIIGWLYQYYNTELKDEVINMTKRVMKKEDIPAATQLFTTEWVVKYMVDNSLGKYWLERNPDSNIKKSLEYLMPGEIETIDEKISPENLKVFDNAMGSGHCLSYTFEVLLMIYKSEGYTARNAAKLIIENNLYGLDIDERAYQLAYFAIMMKARQHNRRILTEDVNINLAVFEDSTDIDINHLESLGQSMESSERDKALEQVEYLIKEFKNAREIGSILILEEVDSDLILEFINDGPKAGQILMGEIDIDSTQEKLRRILEISSMLTQKYDVLVTNPPYMNKYSPNLKKYIWDNYPEYKQDLFSVFIYRNLELSKNNGYSAYMTPFVWMFIKSYEKLRKYIIENKHISSLIQMEYSAFEEATVPICTFVIKNRSSNQKGNYIRLSDFKGGMEVQRIRTLEAIENPSCGYYYERDQDNFKLIPGSPISYWASDNMLKIFMNENIYKNSVSASQNVTGNNAKYLRFFWEVEKSKISKEIKWIFYAKGGGYRKWIGNMINIINWTPQAREKYRTGHGSQIVPEDYWYKKGITWGLITSNLPSFRVLPTDSTFDKGGSSIFINDSNKFNYILGILNSKVFLKVVKIFNPTLNFQVRDIRNMPVIEGKVSEVNGIVNDLCSFSKTDWDSFESSWDFENHPLLDTNKQKQVSKTIELAYENYKEYANNNFEKLKQNEEKLNELFIEIYGLEDELTPEISDKDITIIKIFDHKDEIYDDIKGNRYIQTKEDIIKSFISYGVGCMFGRYSLDEEGLVYAGGEWDGNRYETFKPTEDNVLIITDEEYFEDDIVNRFVEFVEVTYGKETLEENLEFIADSLSGSGSPKEKIRNYFMNGFYKDHVQTYKKTPIYWLYDSSAGKYKRDSHDGFKALIYMHRYDEDTTGKVRIDYLHKLQKEYEFKMDNLRYEIEHSENTRQVARAEKELDKLTKQLKEAKDYDEKIGHLALARIPIDLDDGVKVNYDKIQKDENGKKLKILAKI